MTFTLDIEVDISICAELSFANSHLAMFLSVKIISTSPNVLFINLHAVVEGRKWLVEFNAGKTQLVSFDRSNNTGAIDKKMDGSVLGENHFLRCWGCLPLLNWIRALTLSLLLELPPRKLEPWFVLWSLFLLRLLCITINLTYGLHGILLSCLR